VTKKNAACGGYFESVFGKIFGMERLIKTHKEGRTIPIVNDVPCT